MQNIMWWVPYDGSYLH